MYWFNTSRSAASLNFLAEMHKNKETCHESFLKWMRCVGHDYRHATTWDGGWMLIALHEYLRLTPAGNEQATVTLENGQQLTLGNGPTVYTPAHTPTLAEIPTTITRTDGTAYVSVKFKAQPEQTEYPGVTEKGSGSGTFWTYAFIRVRLKWRCPVRSASLRPRCPVWKKAR